MSDNPDHSDIPDTLDGPDGPDGPDENAAAASATGWGTQYVKLRHRLTAGASLGSLLGAFLVWWPSLRPSLLPRSWMLQGAVGAICAVAGFGVGGFIHRMLRRSKVTDRWSPSQTAQRTIRTSLLVLALVGIVVGSFRWHGWQRDQAPLVTLEPPSAWSILPMLLTTVVLFVVLLTLGRLIKHFIAFIDRRVGALIPGRLSRFAVVAATLAMFALAFGIITRTFTDWADTNFSTFDTTTDEGIELPQVDTVSGGAHSLVKWDDLGNQGRTFIGRTPSVDDLKAFRDTPTVKEPVRVYVGLKSADTTEERVALAVKELDRTKAWDRKVLMVVTPTGTGWVNPDAARTLEFMYGGDTAIVGVQYSFLPSWIAFLLDTKSPRVLGEALFNGVHDAWAKQPADHRPKLVAYGESLGSLGGEQAFANGSLHDSIADMTSRTDAALFVGPTRSNPIFGGAIDHRDAGSRSWQPVLAAEPNVRFANRIQDITADGTAWKSPRVLYLHHPSDAIGTWQPSNLWSPPGWAEDPAAYDIPPAATWLPFVTFTQEAFDLMNGFSAAPGYGHDYRNSFVHAWAAILPPEGWTEADSQALLQHLGL